MKSVAVPDLREVQVWMKSRIRPGAAPVARGARLNSQRGVPGEARLAVYADGYVARMQEALEDVYPAIRRMVGAKRFAELSAAFAADRPSRQYNLNAVGEALPEWLEAWPASVSLLFLPDLARLERAIAHAFHAPQEPVAAGLDTVSPEHWPQLRFRFQPETAVLSSRWPILDLWMARTQPPGTMDLQVEGRPQHVLVFREGLQVRCELLDTAWAAAAVALMAGKTLGEALAHAAGTAPAVQAEALFARWAAAGMIVDVF